MRKSAQAENHFATRQEQRTVDLFGISVIACCHDDVIPENYRVTNSVDSVFDSRALKKRALAIAMQTNTAPNVQTMVAPVGKSKYTEK